ncbi:DMT family transporter [Brevibacillus porteri]|uniref:DMT family transporter n=1 Tax=Brevibacillus porteri TaxID=2126350 RepID=UPI00370B8937
MITLRTTTGILYAFIWATAAIATKIGLVSSSPLLFASTRLFFAGIILFAIVYIANKKYPFPKGKEWGNLIILGLLNSTIYVGCCFLSLDHVDSSIFNLFLTFNPFIVAFLSSIFLNRTIKRNELVGMCLSALGLGIALYPYINDINGTLFGFITLGIGVFSMGIGSIYFSKIQMRLPGIVVNTWQIILGSAMAMPLSFLLEPDYYFHLDFYFGFGLFWQAIVVSIIAMLLWFSLLKEDPVRANNFLFLTPIFGYMLSAIFLGETITNFHYIGALFVIIGTVYSQTNMFGLKQKEIKIPVTAQIRTEAADQRATGES